MRGGEFSMSLVFVSFLPLRIQEANSGAFW